MNKYYGSYLVLFILILLEIHRIKTEECQPKIFPTFGPVNTLVTFENIDCFNSQTFSNFMLEKNLKSDIQLKLKYFTKEITCSQEIFKPIIKFDGSYFNNTNNWRITNLPNLAIYNHNLSVSICHENQCIQLNETKFILKFFPTINESIIVKGSRKTILSGGAKQEFYGTNFNSLSNPYLDIFIENELLYQSFLFLPDVTKPYEKRRNAICSIELNGTKMVCSTPKIGFFMQNILSLKFYLLLSYSDMKTDAFYRIDVFDDPKFSSLSPEVKDYPYSKRPHSFLFSAERTLDVLDESDYRITVGGFQGTNVTVFDNAISFVPPSEEPPASEQDLDGARPVVLYAGNIEQNIGYIQYNPKNPDWHWIVGVACGAAALIILAIIIGYCIYLRDNPSPPSPPPDFPDYIPNDLLHKKIDFSDLEFGKEISRGNYGKVLLAIMKLGRSKVAVKTALEASGQYVDPSLIQDIYAEARVMKDINHPNVMKLIGICVDKKTIPYLVIPFMSNGDLKKYLRREEETFTLEDLLKFALDILRGMEYLNSLKIIHRDLAARNCMVDESRSIRVSDFGLSRRMQNEDSDYYRPTREDICLPVKWLALECFEKNRKFTEKSDVWSFGVLMWEILTRGEQPYPNVFASDIYGHINSENRLENPDVDDQIYDSLMWRCWLRDPADRPSFTELRSAVERKLSIEESCYLKPIY